ncbi:MAG: hypothetical protein AAGH15_04855 [Myxococcota bacterium]
MSTDPDVELRAALDAMTAPQLRAVILALVPWLDRASEARVRQTVLEGASRGSGGWSPDRPSDAEFARLEALAGAIVDAGVGDPRMVDGVLLQGSRAFLAGDAATSRRLFEAMLVPLGVEGLDLGQHELESEVLTTSLGPCVRQYAVALYLTCPAEERAQAVEEALDDLRHLHFVSQPLRELETTALEPLPDFDAFLADWRQRMEARAAGARNPWRRSGEGWLHEVVLRLEGTEGLALQARRSREPGDFHGWVRELIQRGDWAAARAANEEAAMLATGHRAEFLDGAALAVQELAREDPGRAGDLAPLLERAWRVEPTLRRLQRWLGSEMDRPRLVARARAALQDAPAEAQRSRALLHLLLGEVVPAARLLVEAPALGWSLPGHPGHVVFPVFAAMLTRGPLLPEVTPDVGLPDGMPRLDTPNLAALFALAAPPMPDPAVEPRMIEAMRSVAERRVEALTREKRRRHYGHAASLLARSARVGSAAAGEAWLAKTMSPYRRFSALRRELRAALS